MNKHTDQRPRTDWLRTTGDATPHASLRKHDLEGFRERQHARMRAAGWAIPGESK